MLEIFFVFMILNPEDLRISFKDMKELKSKDDNSIYDIIEKEKRGKNARNNNRKYIKYIQNKKCVYYNCRSNKIYTSNEKELL